MTDISFQGFPKIPRLFREVVITEKIDGTNGAIGIREFPFGWHVGGVCAGEEDGCGYDLPHDHDRPDDARLVFGPNNTDYEHGGDGMPEKEYLVYAQSRNRVISTAADNHGFAKFVYENAYSLAADLGPGLHFGEWWGSGIGRNYGLPYKRFSLFNVKRWEDTEWKFTTDGLGVVPVIERGEFSTLLVKSVLAVLRIGGSWAAAGYMNPEGVVVYHTAGNLLFKATIEKDEEPKQQQLRRKPDIDVAVAKMVAETYGLAA
jgi:RNA ligase